MKFDYMENKVYVFNNPERDNAEYAKHLALAAMKQPALNEVVKFIFDACHGLNPEISEKTIPKKQLMMLSTVLLIVKKQHYML